MDENEIVSTRPHIPQTTILQYDDVSGNGIQGSVFSSSIQGSVFTE